MLYLILAIVSSASISVIMRISEKYSKNNISMLAMNYLMCSLLGFLYTLPSLTGAQSTSGMGMTVFLGALSGVMYLASFTLLQWNISKNGVVLPATFMKLGVLVPTLMSIVIFGENPRITQVIGFIAAICAIIMIQGGGKHETGSIWGLIVLLIGGGMSDGMSKIYEEVGSPELKNHFLLFIFIVAFVLCVALCIVKKQKLTPADAIFGLAIGVPNYLSSRFLLLSLAEVPAVAAYPSYSVATIVLVALVGVIFFKEKMSRRKLIALGIILAALVLLNL